MFRDIKEYQELQKLYEDKVSTSKNIDEGLGQFIDKLRGISPKDREDINKEKMVIKSLKDSDKFKEVRKDGKKVIQSTTNNTKPKLTDQDRSDIKKEQDAIKLQKSIKSGEFKKLEAEIEKKKTKGIGPVVDNPDTPNDEKKEYGKKLDLQFQYKTQKLYDQLA